MIFKDNRIYDALKWFVLVGAGALSALISGLGLLYGFDSHLIVGTIGLISAFIGAVIGVSGNKYEELRDKQPDEEDANNENGF